MTTPSLIALVNEWLTGKEGENLEFKEAKNRYDFGDLCKYCCALANEGGGWIILGISDARPRKVVGTQAFEQPERTCSGLCNKTLLRIDFQDIMHPDGRVLAFHVPPHPIGIPVQLDGCFWMRQGDSLVPMSGEKLRDIFAEGEDDFSAKTCPSLTIEQLDADAVEDFRRRWVAKASKGEQNELADRLKTLTPKQLLEDAEAIVDDELTYAALILFGTRRAVGRHLAQSEVVFEYRSSDAVGPAQERQEYRKGFFSFYDDLWNRINLRNDKQDFQQGLFVYSIPTFQERVVREALLNAVSHRHYQLAGSIFVRQYPRRLEIDSPGGLPWGITLENILDRQKPRNRRIAEIFARCGLVERSGQGMNLIFEELIKQGKPEPDFSRTDKSQVGLTLFGTIQDPAFIQFVEKVSKETTAFFHAHDWQLLLAAANGEPFPSGYEKQIDKLLGLGLIEKVRGRKYMLSRKYYAFVGKKGAYTRKKGLDRERNLALLLKHIQENKATGAPKEELLQVLPNLPETTVRSLLQTLRKRGDAHMEGKKRGARWFPGPETKEN